MASKEALLARAIDFICASGFIEHGQAASLRREFNEKFVPLAIASTSDSQRSYTGSEGPKWLEDAFYSDSKVIKNLALRRAFDEIRRLSAPAQPASDTIIQLQARPADGGDWINIFPEQLYWMAKEANDVRAIESAVPRASGYTVQDANGRIDYQRGYSQGVSDQIEAQEYERNIVSQMSSPPLPIAEDAVPGCTAQDEHQPGCQSGDFGPCDCALSSTVRGQP